MSNPNPTPTPNAVWPEPKQAETHLGTIEYRDVGEGPPLVFLHLVLAEASHWDRMPPLLADRFRCIFPTLPMGRTVWRPAPTQTSRPTVWRVPSPS